MAAENCPPELNTQIQKVRVLIADATSMANQLLAAALERDPRFCIVGTAESTDQILAAAREAPDVVVIATSIGGNACGGFRVIRRLLASNPNKVRAIMLLDRLERELVVESFRAGATGVFCRTEPIEVLWRCIETVHRGQIWVNDEELKFVLDALTSPPPVQSSRDHQALTGREKQITRLIAEGLTNRQIAAELGLNENTLKTCLRNLFNKLHVATRSELVIELAARTGDNMQYPITPEEHTGYRVDDDELFEWYCRAAGRSYPSAQLKLGEMHCEGRGTPRDVIAAYTWFLLAEASSKEIVSRSDAYRESLASEMTDEQMAEAERNASEWLLRHEKGLLPQPNSESRGNSRQDPRISRAKYRLLA